MTRGGISGMGVFKPICVATTVDQLNRAKARHAEYMQIFADRGMAAPRDSLRDGRGYLAGALGEIVKHDYFMGVFTWPVTYQEIINWDLCNKLNGKTFDVKTKERTHEPWDHYYCSVAEYNIDQQCDYYSFVSTSDNLRYVYLLGYISKSHFMHIAKKAKEDEYDDTSPPNTPFYFACDCRNVRCDQLTPFKPVRSRSIPRLAELTY
jgi:hypothetical protein